MPEVVTRNKVVMLNKAIFIIFNFLESSLLLLYIYIGYAISLYETHSKQTLYGKKINATSHVIIQMSTAKDEILKAARGQTFYMSGELH